MPPNTERRKRFKAGLALQEKTQSAFAREHNVTLQHLQEVLVGRRKSQRLDAAIDEVIAALGQDEPATPPHESAA